MIENANRLMDKRYVREIIENYNSGDDLEIATRKVITGMSEQEVIRELQENRFMTRGIPLNVLRSRLHVLFRSKAKKVLMIRQPQQQSLIGTTTGLVGAGLIAGVGLGALGAITSGLKK